MKKDDCNEVSSTQHEAHNSVSLPHLLARATDKQRKPIPFVELSKIRTGIIASLAINFIATIACLLVMVDLRIVSPIAASGIMVGVLASCCSTGAWLLWITPDGNYQSPVAQSNNRPKVPTQSREEVKV